jgi:hypothetical protein
MTRTSIKLVHAALDDEKGEIICRGVIDPESLSLLKVADYQREVLSRESIRTLALGFKEGSSFPDLDLGMRGGDYLEREGAIFLQDPVYIVDGRQRTTAAIEAMKEGTTPRLGAVIHFNTTEKWERERFKLLNTSRTRLSADVLIRNLRAENQAAELLFNLANDSSFVLYRRVCYTQRMKRDELVRAVSFVRTAGLLHRNLGHAGGLTTFSWESVLNGLEKLIKNTTRSLVRNNIRTFWDLINDNWGLRNVAYKEGAVYLHTNFLFMFAELLSDYTDFWEDDTLHVDRHIRSKMKLFPLTDPHIRAITGAGGASRGLLKRYLVDHINSGKRSRRLTPIRKSVQDELVDLEPEATPEAKEILVTVEAK